MSDFPGFGISGYRSLYGDPQWLPLGNAVTVVLGGNNSGKSNVLRLLHFHMRGMFGSVSERHALQSFDPRHDVPRVVGGGPLEVHWPVDLARAVESGFPSDVAVALEGFPSLFQFGQMTLPFRALDLTSRLDLDPDIGVTLTRDLPAIPWTGHSSRLASVSGGAPGEDAARVMDFLRRFLIEPPLTEYVPPSRRLAPGAGATDEWNFSGDGLIARLSRLKNPEFDEDHFRERAHTLTEDLRTLLEDDQLVFDVPHDQSTVNVRLGGQYYPLSSLGTGTEHAVLILAARHVYPDRLLCLEEPDAHLHPRLQRRLVTLLRGTGERRVVVATHSAHMIDASETVVSVRLEDGRSSITEVGDHRLFDELRALGYRASDLLQANCLVWVEGPSDRIYLLRWLHALAPDLVEGIDFSVAFYGGALLSRLSGAIEGPVDPSLVDLWRINRRMWVVMDSDLGEGVLKPAVVRLQSEIGEAGSGGTWITAGYTIENYIDAGVLFEAVREVHPSVVEIDGAATDVDPLKRLRRDDGNYLTRVDKVGVALAVTTVDPNLNVLDLAERLDELVTFIREHPVTQVPEVPTDPEGEPVIPVGEDASPT